MANNNGNQARNDTPAQQPPPKGTTANWYEVTDATGTHRVLVLNGRIAVNAVHPMTIGYPWSKYCESVDSFHELEDVK